jgi:hypothetical protein
MNVLGLRFTQLNFWLTFKVFQSLFLTQFLNLYWYWLKNQIGSLLWHLTDVELTSTLNSFPTTGIKKAFLTEKNILCKGGLSSIMIQFCGTSLMVNFTINFFPIKGMDKITFRKEHYIFTLEMYQSVTGKWLIRWNLIDLMKVKIQDFYTILCGFTMTTNRRYSIVIQNMSASYRSHQFLKIPYVI